MSEGHAEGDYVRYVGGRSKFYNYTIGNIYVIIETNVNCNESLWITDDLDSTGLWPKYMSLSYFDIPSKEEVVVALCAGKVRK